MPIINIRFIKDVVATEEQKAELIEKMTDTFVGVLGDVVRPFTYCIIDEVPIGLWGIGGADAGPAVPSARTPAEVREKSNQTMRDAIAQIARTPKGRGVAPDVGFGRSERDHPPLEQRGLSGARARPRDHLAEHEVHMPVARPSAGAGRIDLDCAPPSRTVAWRSTT
jgi:4-oxalocrotonate tautomerase